MDDKKGSSIGRAIIWMTLYSTAMALLEAVLVVYLRQHYFPSGFYFPLKIFDLPTFRVEIIREFATMAMLVAVSALAARSFSEWLAYFLFNFGMWDIFYYIWLKVLLDWPATLLEWDILFLIPIAWVGPVLAPVICATTMIALAGIILHATHQGIKVKIKLLEWSLLNSGSLIIFTIFIRDYTILLIGGGFWQNILGLFNDPAFIQVVEQFIPQHFPWGWFAAGEVLILLGIFNLFHRITKNK
ncbi:MAG TPA: hypothetical protein G4N92_09220 [Anaerolineae bacterium]|nr:hypothetical protein [Anaerolineae bacterium]